MLPTLGGQTGLNLAMELQQAGVLERFGCELIGADAEAIETAEDREKFKVAMTEIGLESAQSAIAHTMDEAQAAIDEVGLPVIIRPAYILGGRAPVLPRRWRSSSAWPPTASTPAPFRRS